MLRDVINGGDNVLAVGIDHQGGHGLLLHVYTHGAFIIVENFL
jgi:hypothetical protein